MVARSSLDTPDLSSSQPIYDHSYLEKASSKSISTLTSNNHAGIFGQAAASSSSSGFSFGNTGGLFGSSQPASTASSLFGTFTPSLFGSTSSGFNFGSQAAQSAPSNVFGQQQQQNQIVPAGYANGEISQIELSSYWFNCHLVDSKTVLSKYGSLATDTD